MRRIADIAVTADIADIGKSKTCHGDTEIAEIARDRAEAQRNRA